MTATSAIVQSLLALDLLTLVKAEQHAHPYKFADPSIQLVSVATMLSKLIEVYVTKHQYSQALENTIAEVSASLDHISPAFLVAKPLFVDLLKKRIKEASALPEYPTLVICTGYYSKVGSEFAFQDETSIVWLKEPVSTTTLKNYIASILEESGYNFTYTSKTSYMQVEWPINGLLPKEMHEEILKETFEAYPGKIVYTDQYVNAKEAHPV